MILEVMGREARVFLKAGCVGIRDGEGERAFAPELIEALLLSTGQRVTTDLLRFCAEHGIDVVITDHYGFPKGRVIGLEETNHTRLRRRQICCDQRRRRRFVQWVLRRKIENQVQILRLLGKGYKVDTKPSREILTRCGEELKGISTGDPREKAIAVEGRASRIYFETISRILPERFRFNERSRNPARDFFNCLLNFGYGHLYWRVEGHVIKRGFDPFAGVLHSNRRRMKSFVYDLTERYRIFPERAVLLTIAMRKVKGDLFDGVTGGFLLNRRGREVFGEVLTRVMEGTIGGIGSRFEREIQEDLRYLKVEVFR
jgi:CRISPR-associated protein Cas1